MCVPLNFLSRYPCLEHAHGQCAWTCLGASYHTQDLQCALNWDPSRSTHADLAAIFHAVAPLTHSEPQMTSRIASLFHKSPSTPPGPEQLYGRGGEQPLRSPIGQPTTPAAPATANAAASQPPRPVIVIPDSEAVDEGMLSIRTDAARPSVSSTIMLAVTPTTIDPRPSITSSAPGDAYSAQQQQQLQGDAPGEQRSFCPPAATAPDTTSIAAIQPALAPRGADTRIKLTFTNVDAYGMPELLPIDHSALASRRRARGSRNSSTSSPIPPPLFSGSDPATTTQTPTTSFPRSFSDLRRQIAYAAASSTINNNSSNPVVMAPVRTLVQPTEESGAWVVEV